MIAIILGTILLTAYLNLQRLIPNWSYPVSFAVAFFLGWIWCSYMITKWKIWAYDNELKKRAIQEKLIWADNSFFAKTEICTAKDNEKLNFLKNKFRQNDIFQDDFTVPVETLIYYSKSKSLSQIITMLFVLAVGMNIVLDMDGYFFIFLVLFF